MKKLLLTGAAFVAFAATPAMAEGLSLDLAGHFKGYGVYNNADLDPAVEAALGINSSDLREVNFRKDTEIHFTGETTLDSGLTVGVHVETQVDGDGTSTGGVVADEAYMYASGGWGRVNFGEEDGAAYLLQVAAPSADANVDGIRQFISTSVVNDVIGALDYDHADASDANKLTYMTPVFNGFQAGVSYTAAATDSANGTTTTDLDNDAGLDDGYELAARYEAELSGVGVTVGAGYSNYGNETDVAGLPPVIEVTDNVKTWNAGLGLGFGDVNVGVSYLDTSTELNTVDADEQTLVLGADYTMGAYKVGASYLNLDEAELDRYTVGGSYAYGPGMSFRGSISHIDADDLLDETQVLVGTQVNF